MSEEFIYEEICETPRAIRETLANSLPQAHAIAEDLQRRSVQRIFVIGNGTSYYSSLAAAYTARRLAQAGSQQVYPMMAGDFRYYTPTLGKGDAILGISASGEFRDVLEVFERFNSRLPCIGITQVPGSSVTRLATHLLYGAGGQSRVSVMTKTYASTLTAAHLLLLAIFDAPPAAWESLQDVPQQCERAILACEQALPEILPHFDMFEHVFHFGAGCAFAAAMESALKMKEMAILHAEGSETWEMASGSAIILDDKKLCLALYSGGGGDPSTSQTARHAKSWGARVLEIGPSVTAGDLHIPVRPPEFEPFASLCLVPPLALLAYRLAQRRGFNPDQPEWEKRYLVQGMSHAMGKDRA